LQNENLNSTAENLDVSLTNVSSQKGISFLINKIENIEKQQLEYSNIIETQKETIFSLQNEIDLLKEKNKTDENSFLIFRDLFDKFEQRIGEIEKLDKVEAKDFILLKENFDEISKKTKFCFDFIEILNKIYKNETYKNQGTSFEDKEAEWKCKEDPKKTFFCKECKSLAKNCYNCLSCSRNFCFSCLNKGDTCPKCKEPTEKRSYIDESIKKLKGSCSLCFCELLNGEFQSHVVSFHSDTFLCPGSVLGCKFNGKENESLSLHKSCCQFFEILKLKDFQSKVYQYLSQFNQLTLKENN
jgi:hypothetical protein